MTISEELKRADEIVIIVEAVDIKEFQDEWGEAGVFALAQLKDILLAAVKDETLRKKAWLVLASSSMIAAPKIRDGLLGLMRLIPHMACAFFDLDAIAQKNLARLVEELNFSMPPFRVFGCLAPEHEDWESLAKIKEIAVELANEQELLGHLVRKWCACDWTNKEEKIVTKLWCLADLHVEAEPLDKNSPLAWFIRQFRKLPAVELPDAVVVLGDIFHKGSCSDCLGVPGNGADSLMSVLRHRLNDPCRRVYVVPGEHDFTYHKKPAIHYSTREFENWVDSMQRCNVTSAYQSTLEESLKNLGESIRLEAGLSTPRFQFGCKEAMAVVAYQAAQKCLPVRLFLASTFDPTASDYVYNKSFKGGTTNPEAEEIFSMRIKEKLDGRLNVDALNLVCMHHALNPNEMKTITSATKAVGEFKKVLDILGISKGISAVVLHGHTHIFHFSNMNGWPGLIHVGVPRLGRGENPYEQEGFVSLSVVSVAERSQYALCICRYMIHYDYDSSPIGNAYLPEKMWVLEITVDNEGAISLANDDVYFFQARFTSDGGFPCLHAFHIDKVDNMLNKGIY